MVEFSRSNAAEFIDEDDEMDEEPGEVIESAPPLQVGEERVIDSSGIKKKLIKRGIGWETPDFGDEISVHYVGRLLDGTEFVSTRVKSDPLLLKLGHDETLSGLSKGITSMTKGEKALFTVPPRIGHGLAGDSSIPRGSTIQLEVELISWIRVVDVCKDGGIIKKIMEQGGESGPPGDLDEVTVKYSAMLDDGSLLAKSHEAGVEFHVKEGHFCPALTKAVKTMKRGEKVKLVVQPQYALGDGNESSLVSSLPPNAVLLIDLELVSIKPVIDVCGDSKVLKKITKDGEGVTADSGASVAIRYTATLEDGTVFEKRGCDGLDPLEFVTDEEQVITGLDQAAMTMKKGECALLTVDPEYGFGSNEVVKDLAIIPPCSRIVYEVEMLDFIREKTPREMSDQERIETATSKKEEGNVLFKDGNYKRAGKKYEKALDYVAEDAVFGENDLRLVQSLKVSSWLNSAACCLKLNDFQEVIKLCSKVLDIEFSNIKALFRRAQAYLETGDLLLAERDINKALEADPLNREVKLLQKKLKELKAESDKRDAKLYSTMFPPTHRDCSASNKKRKIGGSDNSRTIEEASSVEMESSVAISQPDQSNVS